MSDLPKWCGGIEGCRRSPDVDLLQVRASVDEWPGGGEEVMMDDTAGNPIYAVPAYCETCGGPTNTAGQCPKQSCARGGGEAGFVLQIDSRDLTMSAEQPCANPDGCPVCQAVGRKSEKP